MDDKSFNIRVPKRWARVAMIVGVTALIVAPLTAIASHSFSDVPDTNTFHSDIAWLADAGVTKGCNPPDNTEFCPDDNVTRGQMSAFMHRFAQFIGAADGTPAQADSATTADSAGNADTVDGVEAADLVSNAWLVGNDGAVTIPADATTTVETLQLTPGSYVVFANGALNNNAGTIQTGTCNLDVGTDGDITSGMILSANVEGGDKEEFSMAVATTLASTTNATLTCTTGVGWSGNVVSPTITAISVNSATANVAATNAAESQD